MINPGNLHAANGQLQEALESLMLAWEKTREHWQDAQALAFEQEHLRVIEEDVNIVIPAISNMAQVLGRAKRECEE